MEALHADPPGRLQQRLGAQGVGAEEATGVDDGVAVVRLGREVHDDVDGVVVQRALGQLLVADVALHEGELALDGGQVVAVAGVGEQVVDDHLVARVVGQPVVHEVRADEPGAAGDEELHGDPRLLDGQEMSTWEWSPNTRRTAPWGVAASERPPPSLPDQRVGDAAEPAPVMRLCSSTTECSISECTISQSLAMEVKGPT